MEPAATSTPTSTREGATREGLLDAAESLFSEHGIQAASLRAITQRAGANLAAVHYHFGSKQGLVRAVFQRRLEPLNRERLALLAACERDGGGTVEGVLRAFVGPLLRMVRQDPDGGGAFARLVGRAFAEPGDEVRQILFDEFKELVDRFREVLARLLPHLPEEELIWRLHFVAGSMGHTVACSHILERYSEGRCRLSDVERSIDLLVQFLAAGLRAPATPGRAGSA
jgi:AcrR family transcriptional regulator